MSLLPVADHLSPQGLREMCEDIFREVFENDALNSVQFRAAVSRMDAAKQKLAAALTEATYGPEGETSEQVQMKVRDAKQESTKADIGVSDIVLGMAESWFEACEKVLSAEESAEGSVANMRDLGDNSREAAGATMAVRTVLLALSLALITDQVLDH